jgi:hypothetical protein
MVKCRRLMNVEFSDEKTVSALHKRKTEVGKGKRRNRLEWDATIVDTSIWVYIHTDYILLAALTFQMM